MRVFKKSRIVRGYKIVLAGDDRARIARVQTVVEYNIIIYKIIICNI